MKTEFAKVLKFNPYHDKATGRFSSKGGAGAARVASSRVDMRTHRSNPLHHKASAYNNRELKDYLTNNASEILPGGEADLPNRRGDHLTPKVKTHMRDAIAAGKYTLGGRPLAKPKAKLTPNAKPGEAKTAPIPNASGKPTLSNYDSARDGKKWRIDSSDKTLNSTERAIARVLDERADRNKPKKAPFPGDTVDKWRTKQGKLTQRAARYVDQRTRDHYDYIRTNITGK